MIVKLPKDNLSPSNSAQHIQSAFIEACLKALDDQDKHPAFLESPEGTDRRATLLCTALSWIEHRSKSHETTKTKVIYTCGTLDRLHRMVQEFNDRIKKNYDSEMIILIENLSMFTESSESKECVMARPVIFFCTHNFLLETITSQSKKDTFSLRDTLVIVDDAHLVDKTARKAASAALSNCVFQTLSKDLENVDKDGSSLANFALNLKILKKIFTLAPCEERNGYINYSHQELAKEMKMLHDAAVACDLAPLKKLTNVDINSVFKFILLIYNFSDDDFQPCKAYATLDYFPGQHVEDCEKGKNCKTLQIVCLDPSFLIKMLSNFGASLIFTSETISPISGFKSELQIESSNDFCGKSFIEDFQVYCRIVTCGAGGYYLNSSFSTRHDIDYLTSVGKSILEFAKLTPNGEGLYIYFVSKDLLDLCVSHWKNANSPGMTLWDNICKYKNIIVIEDQLPVDTDKLNEKGTCVLLLIRGQVPDNQIPIENRRVMVFVGVPFIFTEDPELKLKKKYMLESKMNNVRKSFWTGSQYEEWEAYKLINQVINRFISSKSQHGVILFCDSRYDERELCPWVQSKLQRENRFSELLCELKDFFFHVKERVSSCFQASDEVLTQFEGKVKLWEFEKSRMEYLKLKKRNDRYSGREKYLEGILEKSLETIITLKQELERLKIQALEIKSPIKREFSAVAPGNDEIPETPAKVRLQALPNSSIKQEGTGTQVGEITRSTPVSPLKEELSRLGIQSPAKKGNSVKQAESPEIKSLRKRSYPE